MTHSGDRAKGAGACPAPAEPGSLLIIGAGGHARVLAEGARRAGFAVSAFIDRAPAQSALAAPDRTPVVAEKDFLCRLECEPRPLQVALGLGEAGLRHRVMSGCPLGHPHPPCHAPPCPLMSYPAIIDPTAVIAEDVEIGAGAAIMAHAVVNSGARVGPFAIVNTGAILEHDVVIGPYAAVAPGACLGGGAQVGEGAFVGLGARVGHGVTIGAQSVLGAGAVAVRDVPAECVAYGVPAKVRRHREPWSSVLLRRLPAPSESD